MSSASDSVNVLFGLVKSLGGPDYTKFYRKEVQRTGTSRKRDIFNSNESLSSDPLFCELVDWIGENVDEKCILRQVDIVNYENLTKQDQNCSAQQAERLTCSLAPLFAIDPCELVRTIEDLKIELDIAVESLKAEREHLSHLVEKERVLKNAVKELKVEIQSVERVRAKTVENSERADSYLSVLQNQASNALEKFIVFASKVNNLGLKSTSVLNCNYIECIEYFAQLKSCGVDRVLQNYAELIPVLLEKHSGFWRKPEFDDLLDLTLDAQDLQTDNLDRLFDLVVKDKSLRQHITTFSNDYARLKSEVELLALRKAGLDRSLEFLAQVLKNPCPESICMRTSQELTKSFRDVSNALEKKSAEMLFMYRTNMEKCFSVDSMCGCINHWIKCQEASLCRLGNLHGSSRKLETLIKLVLHFCAKNKSKIEMFGKEIGNVDECLSILASSLGGRKDGIEAGRNQFYTNKVYKAILPFCNQYVSPSQDGSGSRLIEFVRQFVSTTYSMTDVMKETESDVPTNIGLLVSLLHDIIQKYGSDETVASGQQPELVPRDLLSLRNELNDCVEKVKMDFEDVVTQLEWSKKTLCADESRARIISEARAKLKKV